MVWGAKLSLNWMNQKKFKSETLQSKTCLLFPGPTQMCKLIEGETLEEDQQGRGKTK